jgi:hypothetical protein
MSNKTCYLVPQSLWWNHCYLFSESLIGLEVQCETRIVFLNDETCCLLDCLCSDATLLSLLIMMKMVMKKIMMNDKDGDDKKRFVFYDENICDASMRRKKDVVHDAQQTILFVWEITMSVTRVQCIPLHFPPKHTTPTDVSTHCEALKEYNSMESVQVETHTTIIHYSPLIAFDSLLKKKRDTYHDGGWRGWRKNDGVAGKAIYAENPTFSRAILAYVWLLICVKDS